MTNKITLATLSEATAQEVFDQVAAHLLKQGRKSVGDDGVVCTYRGDDGAMCAAGCLIDDSEWRASYENKNWLSLVEKEGVTQNHQGLIGALQWVHDCRNPENWLKYLRIEAEGRGLSLASLERFA